MEGGRDSERGLDLWRARQGGLSRPRFGCTAPLCPPCSALSVLVLSRWTVGDARPPRPPSPCTPGGRHSSPSAAAAPPARCKPVWRQRLPQRPSTGMLLHDEVSAQYLSRTSERGSAVAGTVPPEPTPVQGAAHEGCAAGHPPCPGTAKRTLDNSDSDLVLAQAPLDLLTLAASRDEKTWGDEGVVPGAQHVLRSCSVSCTPAEARHPLSQAHTRAASPLAPPTPLPPPRPAHLRCKCTQSAPAHSPPAYLAAPNPNLANLSGVCRARRAMHICSSRSVKGVKGCRGCSRCSATCAPPRHNLSTSSKLWKGRAAPRRIACQHCLAACWLPIGLPSCQLP